MALVERERESSPSPSSSSTRQPKYDVFLSFRGKDTRYNFTDHLCGALKGKGIITFRDEEELNKGERISELFKAIEESQFAIIIFSIDYASSTWCLDELTKIMKCKDEIGLKVLPVFYNVSPSIVRKQTDTFEEAFIAHQNRFEDNIEKVETWRDALKKVADIKGWDLHQQNSPEFEIIQDIVKGIMEKLSSKSSSINKDWIGINSMVAELIPSYVGFGNCIYKMGIYGMGGLGKTTLARAIYDTYYNHFEGFSFIANVRERSEKGELHKLQQQLLNEILKGSNTKIYNVQDGVHKISRSRLCNKKVLLVLDDVNHKDQLENLVGKDDWFGSGSWIIITTRDELVLKQHKVLKIYKPNELDDDDALTLFCLKAFNKEQPKEGYMQLSQKVVEYASGLPLALVTLGSFLVDRTVEEWQSALDSLKNMKGGIYEILKISYDGLKEEIWKEIFLDIACFFLWWNKDQAIEKLENCGLDARIGISVLVEKSLLSIDDGGCLRMHDLLQEMGKKIVCLKSSGNLGKQSRLWLNEDLLYVLENDMATEAIQGIAVEGWREDFNIKEFSEGFSKMSNLRWLIIYRISYLKEESHLSLPNNLRYLRWRGCPFKCLASKQRMGFVRLDLQYSNFEYLWEGVMRSVNLKFIDLSCSEKLIRTPDFSGVPNLEELRLSCCSRLVEIHRSIGQLSRLRYLHLRYCESLTDLPCISAVMQSLKVLDLSLCFKFSSFPKFTGIMESLSELNLSQTAIEKVEPSSIKCLPALTFLDLSVCGHLECLPSNMDNLRSLKKLNLKECKKLESLPVRLPSTIKWMMVQRCSSIKWIQKWVKLSIWSQLFSKWFPYDERRGRVGFKILFYFLQGLLCCKAVLYGSIISSYLTNQRVWYSPIRKKKQKEEEEEEEVGYSISIKLPSNWHNSKWIGFALWTSLPEFLREECDIRARVIAVRDIHRNHHASELFPTLISFEVNICLLYLSRDDWFAKVGNGECNQINVIFETDTGFQFVGESGVSLIYKQDVNEFNQTNVQCLIKSFGGEVSIFKLTTGGGDDDDDDDDGHIVNDDVHIVRGDELLFDDDDFYDADIN